MNSKIKKIHATMLRIRVCGIPSYKLVMITVLLFSTVWHAFVSEYD